MFHDSLKLLDAMHFFKCPHDKCSASFELEKDLNRHTRIHRNELQYSCYYCQYRNLRQYNFENHLRAHYQIFDFQCAKCDYKATTKNILEGHINSKHDKTKYACSLCKQILSVPKAVHQHLKNQHKLKREKEWRKYLVTIEAKITPEDMKEVFGENYKQK